MSDLPRLMLVGDRFTRPDRAERCVELVWDGVPWVQLRDHEAEDDAFAAVARRLTRRLRTSAEDRRPSAPLISINRRVDLAAELGAGCHLPAWTESLAEARERLGENVSMGVSAHDRQEIERAISAGADYLTYGPVFSTPSKPEAEGAGLDALREAVEAAAPTPVLALGGVTPERVPDCRAAGAYGVAVLSGLLLADRPGETAELYRAAERDFSDRDFCDPPLGVGLDL